MLNSTHQRDVHHEKLVLPHCNLIAACLTSLRLAFSLLSVKAKIVQIGGSPAIPVPQPLLDACHLHNEVEMEAQGGCLVIRNPRSPREGWEEAFRQMAASGDDKLILNDAPATRWDEEEWEW